MDLESVYGFYYTYSKTYGTNIPPKEITPINKYYKDEIKIKKV